MIMNDDYIILNTSPGKEGEHACVVVKVGVRVICIKGLFW